MSQWSEYTNPCVHYDITYILQDYGCHLGFGQSGLSVPTPVYIMIYIFQDYGCRLGIGHNGLSVPIPVVETVREDSGPAEDKTVCIPPIHKQGSACQNNVVRNTSIIMNIVLELLS